MQRIKLIFGACNNVPYGSSDYLFEQVYQKAYKPFLTELYHFNEINLTLYYSGVVLDWLEKNHPEFIMLLNDMVKRKQIEILGGGYYHPAFPLIPHTDRLGQIESLTTYIRELFGKRPRGGWIPESIWEPSLVSMLKSSGLEYIFLREHHFQGAGITDNALFAPVLTENQGKIITAFPVLRGSFSGRMKKTPEDAVKSILAKGSSKKSSVVVLMENGEELGYWNDSHTLLYKNKWLNRFLTILEDHKDSIDFSSPGTLNREITPLRKLYFKSSAYNEVQDWFNGTQSQKKKAAASHGEPTFPPGDFRQVLTKYEESNLLYAKMIYTHVLVNQIRGDKARKKTARNELWKGQNHQVYWPTCWGGIYTNSYRKAAYRAFLDAEKITHEKGIFIPSIVSVDFDMDGQEEYLFQGEELNGYTHAKGGVLFELDYLPVSWNYLDTFSRYQEPYHGNGTKNKGLDWFPRKAFMDHFFHQKEKVEAFDTMAYKEAGDFINSQYELAEFHRDQKLIIFRRSGSVKLEKGTCKVDLSKAFKFAKSEITVSYTITNASNKDAVLNFGSELNLSFAANCVESLRLYSLSGLKQRELGLGKKTSSECTGIRMEDITNKVEITFSADTEFTLWSLPVETVHKTHEGYSEQYQSTCFLPRWKLNLKPEESWKTDLRLSFKRIRKRRNG